MGPYSFDNWNSADKKTENSDQQLDSRKENSLKSHISQTQGYLSFMLLYF